MKKVMSGKIIALLMLVLAGNAHAAADCGRRASGTFKLVQVGVVHGSCAFVVTTTSQRLWVPESDVGRLEKALMLGSWVYINTEYPNAEEIDLTAPGQDHF